MSSLQRTCACTRYFSPTRLGTSVHLQPKKPNGASSSPARWHSPERSRSFTVNSPRGEQPYTHQSRASSFVANKVSQYVNAKKESAENMKNSVKQWAMIKKSQLDVTALTKIVSSLNIEVPRSWPDYQKYLQMRPMRSKTASEEIVNKPPPEQVDNQSNGFELKSESMLKVRTQSVHSVDGNQLVHQEKHDFSEAMKNTEESIRTYYSSMNLDVTSSSIPKLKNTAKKQNAEDGTQSSAKQKVPDTESDDRGNIIVRQIASLKQMLPSSKVGRTEGTQKVEEKTEMSIKKPLVAKSSVDRRTRGLVLGLRKSSTNMSQVVRLEELNKHLVQYPDAKNEALKTKVLPTLLRLRTSRDVHVREQALECLALVGFVDPVRGRGIRILSLDGGGTKGLMTIEILKKIEEHCKRDIHELFDYICGVSTGSLIGIMLAVFRVPLEECEYIYQEFSKEMFSRNKLVGASKLFTSHSYYDSQLWEEILKENIGFKTFIESRRDKNCPKISAVSTLVNQPTVENFLFRNYTYPTRVYSHYPGTMQQHLWEAIRASSAAPGYYEEFKLGEHIHQDGGLLTNNPTAIAIHECRLLWPSSSLQCVVSVGTGRYRPTQQLTTSYSLKDKLLKIVQSATDTEAVHTTMHDLVAPGTYFRFNPYMSEDFLLDEVRPDKWDQMKHDAQMYCRKNEVKLKTAAQRLTLPKQIHQTAADWLKLKAHSMSAKS